MILFRHGLMTLTVWLRRMNAWVIAAKAAGEMLDIRVLGLAVIASDVSADLARATITALHILGALQASDAVKAALADRIT